MQSAPNHPLSGRQAEIAALIVSGKSNREIAQTLFLSPRTVENHIAAIFNKLSVGSRVELVTALLHPEAGFSEGLTVARASKTNLPPERTRLVGRELELAEIVGMLEENRLVTVTGAGGVGKTRTALAVGDALLTDSPAGVWLVELAPLGQGALVASAVAQALNVSESPQRRLIESLLTHLKAKALVLILDNCEHLIGETAALADTLLRGCPQLRVLATSREPLRIAGELTYRLPSLGVPTSAQARGLDAVAAGGYTAIALFAQRARASDRGFALGAGNAPIVAEICRRLDGIPLAIELAAARANVLPPQALLDKLDRRLAILTGGDRSALPRHQTMRALIDWSYDLLAAPEQLLFACLSIFAGGCDLAEATSVYAEAGELDVLALLSSLVEKSMVVADVARREPRYRLLESSRQYAYEKLVARGTATAVARRHARAYANVAERLECEFDRAPGSAWLARAEPELENWRAAIDWSLGSREDVLVGQRLVAALLPVWTNFSLAEGRRCLRAARELVDERTPLAVAANLDYAATQLTVTFGEWEAALAGSQRLLPVYRELNDSLGVARVQYSAGLALLILGRLGEGEPLLQGALDAARRLGNLRLTGLALKELGHARSMAGKLGEARAYIAEAIECWQSIGADRNAVEATVILAEAEFRAGNVELALDLVGTAIAALRELGSAPFLAVVLLNFAAYLIACDRWAQARAAAREALGLARELQRELWLGWALQHLAAVAALASGDSGRDPAAAETAAHLLGYVDARLGRLGSPREYTEQAEYDRVLAVLGRVLGAEALAALMAGGAASTAERAIEAALSIEVER